MCVRKVGQISELPCVLYSLHCKKHPLCKISEAVACVTHVQLVEASLKNEWSCIRTVRVHIYSWLALISGTRACVVMWTLVSWRISVPCVIGFLIHNRWGAHFECEITMHFRMKLDTLDTILYCVRNEINKDYIYLGIERIEFLVLLLYIIYI